MNLGIAMSWFNQRYFRDRLSMMFEFVPQVRPTADLGAAGWQEKALVTTSCIAFHGHYSCRLGFGKIVLTAMERWRGRGPGVVGRGGGLQAVCYAAS